LTQSNLKSFGVAGSKSNLISGSERMEEIINLKHIVNPTMDIYFDDSFTDDPQNLVYRDIASYVDHIVFSENEVDKERLALFGLEFKKTDTYLYLKLKDYKQRKKIASVIVKEEEMKCFFTLDSVCIILNQKNRLEAQILYEQISFTKVQGILGIHGMIKKTDNYYQSVGSNLKEVLKMKGIDRKRTSTNNIHEIIELFGIDAAKNHIELELAKVMSHTGVSAQHRHISLLAAKMTYEGILNPSTCSGISYRQETVLRNASFEKPLVYLNQAAAKGLYDNGKTYSASVVIGKKIPAGTGTVELITDVVVPNKNQTLLKMPDSTFNFEFIDINKFVLPPVNNNNNNTKESNVTETRKRKPLLLNQKEETKKKKLNFCASTAATSNQIKMKKKFFMTKPNQLFVPFTP